MLKVFCENMYSIQGQKTLSTFATDIVEIFK